MKNAENRQFQGLHEQKERVRKALAQSKVQVSSSIGYVLKVSEKLMIVER